MEPDGVVIVLGKLATHAQHLVVVQLRNVIAHLVALFEAVVMLIVSDQMLVVPKTAVVVLDWRLVVDWVNCSKELYNYRLADADPGFDIGLNALNILPVGGSLRFRGVEAIVAEDLNASRDALA